MQLRLSSPARSSTAGSPSAPPPPLVPTPPLVPPRVRRRVRATLWRHRFLVAALLVGLAALVVVFRLTPRPEPLQPVVVAARNLPAGTSLTAADLRTVDLPVEAVATGSPRDVGAVTGRTLAVAVTDGTVLGSPVLVDDAASGPPGTVVAGVRLAEPALAALLSPGMHVDLLASAPVDLGAAAGTETGTAVAATTLAVRALVLPRPAVPSGEGGLLGTGGAADSVSDLVLVAVTPEEASFLANVSGREAVSAVVVR